jgi:transcriptional regulator with XRE-family HTH domain
MPRRVGQKPERVRHFIREWRIFRGLTQERLADRLETSAATISRLESGKQPYTQPVLEALAYALICEPADLIMRDPNNPIWSIFDTLRSLPPDEQEQIARIVETFRKAA